MYVVTGLRMQKAPSSISPEHIIRGWESISQGLILRRCTRAGKVQAFTRLATPISWKRVMEKELSKGCCSNFLYGMDRLHGPYRQPYYASWYHNMAIDSSMSLDWEDRWKGLKVRTAHIRSFTGRSKLEHFANGWCWKKNYLYSCCQSPRTQATYRRV